jgi:uncharacterized protein YaaR (DUF327 family)
MVENADRLKVAYEDLCNATIKFNETKDVHDLLRYESLVKRFNSEVSMAVRKTGGVPTLAMQMVWFQRYHGFHARGLEKIIREVSDAA